MAFPTSLLLDNFNRSDRLLDNDSMSSAYDTWSNPTKINSGDQSMSIVSNQASHGGGANTRGSACSQGSYDRLHIGTGSGAGVEVWDTLISIASLARVELWWAVTNPNTITPSGYNLRYLPDQSVLQVNRFDSGTQVILLNIGSISLSAGNKIGIFHEDNSTGIIHAYADTGGGWVERGSIADNTYNNGKIGIAMSKDGSAVAIPIDDFGGGLAAPSLVIIASPKILFDLVHFDKATGVAPLDQDIPTSIVPEGIYLFGTRQTIYGNKTGVNVSYGFASSADSSHQWGIWAARDHGVLILSDVDASKANANRILLLYDLNPGAWDNPIVLARARVTKFLDILLGDPINGLRLSYTENNNEADKFHALVWRGMRQQGFSEEQFSDGVTVGTKRDVTFGFPPDICMFLSMGLMQFLSNPEVLGVGDPCLGFAIDLFHRFSLCMTMDWHTQDKENRIQAFNRAVAATTDNKTGGYQGRFDLDYDFSPTGCTLIVVRQDPPSISPGADYRHRVAVMALRGVEARLFRFDTRTTKGYQKIPSSGFVPQAMIAASFNRTGNIEDQLDHAIQSFGMAISTSKQAAIWSHSEYITTFIPTNTNIKNHDDRVLALANKPGDQEAWARFVGWDADGSPWIEWRLANGNAWEVVGVLLGDARGGEPSGGRMGSMIYIGEEEAEATGMLPSSQQKI